MYCIWKVERGEKKYKGDSYLSLILILEVRRNFLSSSLATQ
jgi:hypothetical protein